MANSSKLIGFDRKEILVGSVTQCVALASIAAGDYITTTILLGAAWVGVVIICIIHRGRKTFRAATAIGILILFVVLDWRVYVVQPHDYIEGTKVERKDLKDEFPFGFAIIRQSLEREIWEPNTFQNLKWKIDWDKTEAVPNVEKRTVNWKIRGLAAKSKDIQIEPETIEWGFPMILGKLEIVPVWHFSGEPVVYTELIGDNQRTPVFVIGYRILSENKP